MKAVVYTGPHDVRMQDIPEPKFEKPTDALVRITSTNICGSDLHMYEGRTDIETGRVIGHENRGEVIEVGNAVDRVKVGDWSASLSTLLVAPAAIVMNDRRHFA